MRVCHQLAVAVAARAAVTPAERHLLGEALALGKRQVLAVGRHLVAVHVEHVLEI
jgi:hypothetical protein